MRAPIGCLRRLRLSPIAQWPPPAWRGVHPGCPSPQTYSAGCSSRINSPAREWDVVGYQTRGRARRLQRVVGVEAGVDNGINTPPYASPLWTNRYSVRAACPGCTVLPSSRREFDSSHRSLIFPRACLPRDGCHVTDSD